MSPSKTNALRLLDRAGIGYAVTTYHVSIGEFSAAAVAEAIGMPANQVFKTLLATGPTSGPCFAVVPADRTLDLRALAIERGERKMKLTPLKEVEALTGYTRGAVTILGAKKQYPSVLDASVTNFNRIAVSAGAMGMQMVLSPRDYLAITGGVITPIAR